MKTVTQIRQTGSNLVRANAAYRNKDLESAIALYEEALSQAAAPLNAQIRFNLNLALRRLGRPATSVAASLDHKESGADQLIFDKLHHVTDEQFLESLFDIALWRTPQNNEKSHYLEQLKNNQSDRKSIINTIYQCEEYKQHHANNSVNHTPKTRSYKSPIFGEIEPGSIILPYHKNPKVSVLIPVYGKIEYTMACLKSIADYLPKASFEIIVMDDRSPDDSVSILQKIKHLRVIVNPENLGFLRSCNNGAHHARGEYLFFLNNDTQVKPGWLDELLNTFSTYPNCGLTGSKLIYPDGLLQEAGGIVWQDGSAWNYGSRQDPSQPQFNYARQADYISGAAIMVPAKLYQDLGGFDEIYAPAYYEDTDLAFRIRENGLQVIYQPLSEIVHFEGISSGTDTTQGVKAYQVVNGEKFLQRWQPTLINHRPNGQEPHLERDRDAVGRVLFIDACTPTPDQDSGSIDSYNLMKVFINMGWAVSFIPEDNYAYMNKYTPMLQRIGVQMLYHPHVKSVDEHITVYGQSYNLVMAFRPMVTAKHIDNLRLKCPNAKIVFNTVDLHFLRLEREGLLKKDQALLKQSKELKELELALMKKADLTTVVSSVELRILEEMGVNKVVHLPFSREIRPSNVPFEQRTGLIFVGGFQHTPNVDAVHYFVAEIMPEVRKAIPGVVFNIVGSNTPQTIKDLACEDVIVHGFVENLEPLLDSVRLNMAPLRFGAGTKGKVVQAMASGLPTIGTSLAFEGMGIQDGVTACFADTTTLFVKKLHETYNSADTWRVLAVNGINYTIEAYGTDALRINLRKIIKAVNIFNL
jgi:GT2 family glycosyltransferase/glycosyltransferase involved in cell wall biosynthesis